MEAKDTVMSDKELNNWYEWFLDMLSRKPDEAEKNAIKHLVQAQAEISFKVGLDEGWEQAVVHYKVDTGE